MTQSPEISLGATDRSLFAPALAVMALVLAGCSITIDSRLTDAGNVPCDGTRTEADFSSHVSQVTFIVHQKKAASLNVEVQKTSRTDYVYSVQTLSGAKPTDVTIIGTPDSRGDASPDFRFQHGSAIWSVDVEPSNHGHSDALISGSC